MRIIAGSLRGKKLKEFKGRDIRPTADRIREALFSMLLSRLGSLEGISVLDLFAGTGALGIEALSRGARSCTFVESNAASCRLLNENLAQCRLTQKSQVLHGDACTLAESGRLGGPFDLVFVDPPYATQLVERVLDYFTRSGTAAADSLMVVEMDHRDPLPALCPPLEHQLTRTYGRTSIHLIRVDRGQNAPA